MQFKITMFDSKCVLFLGLLIFQISQTRSWDNSPPRAASADLHFLVPVMEMVCIIPSLREATADLIATPPQLIPIHLLSLKHWQPNRQSCTSFLLHSDRFVDRLQPFSCTVTDWWIGSLGQVPPSDLSTS
jgi:hypothetical protein